MFELIQTIKTFKFDLVAGVLPTDTKTLFVQLSYDALEGKYYLTSISGLKFEFEFTAAHSGEAVEIAKTHLTENSTTILSYLLKDVHAD
jgi:hypothetical protein